MYSGDRLNPYRRTKRELDGSRPRHRTARIHTDIFNDYDLLKISKTRLVPRAPPAENLVFVLFVEKKKKFTRKTIRASRKRNIVM